jgi:hypothetical protein
MSALQKFELDLVGEAITVGHELQDLLDAQERWTAVIRREAHEKMARLTGLLHAANFELTGDAEGVMNTLEDIHHDTLYRLAA